MKFLGVTLDDRLNYNENTDILSKKLSCELGIMNKVSNLVSPHFLYNIITIHCLFTNIIILVQNLITIYF